MRSTGSAFTRLRIQRGSRLGALSLLVGLVAGCSHPGKGLAPGSYERGVAEFEGGRYFDAVEDLKLFVRRNPTDPRADDAQFHIAMARFEDEDYPVAAVEFEILRTDYPNSELVEDAWYMEGLCYVEQVPPIEKDQKVTYEAIDHFERYLREYPQGTRADEAREQIRRLQLHLDQKILAGARLYRRLGRLRAALVTDEVLLTDRPQSELRPQALFFAAEMHEKLGEIDEARAVYRQLQEEFPGHALSERARRRLEDLGPDRAASG